MRKEYGFTRANRGPVMPPAQGKTRVTSRPHNETLDWFQDQVESAAGGSYQTLINHALREHISPTREPLESAI